MLTLTLTSDQCKLGHVGTNIVQEHPTIQPAGVIQFNVLLDNCFSKRVRYKGGPLLSGFNQI